MLLFYRDTTRGVSATPATNHLQRGREFYARRAWADAFDALTLADGATPLDSAGLDLAPEQLAAIQRAADDLVRERAAGTGSAVLSNAINLGMGQKPM